MPRNRRPRRSLARLAPRMASSVLVGVFALGAFAMPAADASAQPKDKKKQEELRPPVPPQSAGDMPTHYMGLTVLLLGIGLVVGINLIPSKRGHQD